MMKNVLGTMEYVLLRLVRRFLFRDRLVARCKRWLPYYARSLNETEPESIADRYISLMSMQGIDPGNKTILEIGVGATNGVGYWLAKSGIRHYFGYEPFAEFEATLDRRLRESANGGSKTDAPSVGAVSRVRDLAEVRTGSADIVLSNSVFEHVNNIEGLLDDLIRVLTPGGVMIHFVDYRDHFFKYPFGFYRYSDHAWHRWLNPGDLYRRRMPDHVQLIEVRGFDVVADSVSYDWTAFKTVEPCLDPQFQHYTRETLAIAGAALICRRTV